MPKFLTKIVFILLFLFFSSTKLFAQDKEVIQLSLDKVSQLALENNLDIQLVKFDAYIKRNDLYNAVSIFDTILTASVSYEDDQTQRTNSIVGTKSIDTDYEFELEKKLPFGTTLSIGFEHSREWSDSAFATLNPAHDSQATVSITQELGKNFFGLIDRSDIKITKLDIKNSDYTCLDKIEAYLADIQKAYWRVVLNREKVKIREEMLDRAVSLYKIYQQKTKIGLAENPDLYAAEANVNIRKNELLTSQNDLNMSENELLLKLNVKNPDKLQIFIDEHLTIEGVQEQRFIQSLNMAINNRRDYQSDLNDIVSKNINVVRKKNSLWPQIDLQASFTRNGVANYYRDAMDEIIGENNPKFYYGIKFSYPLENRAARSQYEIAKLEKAKSLILLKKKEREIVVQIKDAVGSVNTALEKVKNNYNVVRLQEKKLQEEEKRFKLGRSNSDTLIRYHNDLLAAKISLVDSLYQFYCEFIDLKVKENSLLSDFWKDTL